MIGIDFDVRGRTIRIRANRIDAVDLEVRGRYPNKETYGISVINNYYTNFI